MVLGFILGTELSEMGARRMDNVSLAMCLCVWRYWLHNLHQLKAFW